MPDLAPTPSNAVSRLRATIGGCLLLSAVCACSDAEGGGLLPVGIPGLPLLP